MAINLTKFIVFSDVYALQNEGFTQKPGHGYDITSDKLMTKLEVYTMWELRVSNAEWVELANDQWVARWRMTPPGIPPVVVSAPALTSYPQTNDNQEEVFHIWTQSSPDVSTYQMESYRYGVMVDRWYYYVGFPEVRTRLQRIPRDCVEYTFKVRAYSDVYDVWSVWSNETSVELELNYPFFSDQHYGSFGLNTDRGKIDDGLINAKVTNDGWRVYYIEDEGAINVAISSFLLNTQNDFTSINTFFNSFQRHVPSGSYPSGPMFISDDASKAYMRRNGATLLYLENSVGWSNPMEFDYVFTGGSPTVEIVFFDELVPGTNSITDFILSDDYKHMLIATGTRILGYSCATAWDHNWVYQGEVDMDDTAQPGPPIYPGDYVKEDIVQINFVDNGYGVLVTRTILDTTGYYDIRKRNVVYIELSTAFNMFGAGGIATIPYDRISFGTGHNIIGPHFMYPVEAPLGPLSNKCQKAGVVYLARNEDDTNTYWISSLTTDFPL